VTGGLADAVARIARHEVAARPVAALGSVVEVHTTDGTPPDYAVTVRLRDSQLVLPRVPLAVGVLGFAAIPDVDDLVLVVFADGDYHAPVVVGRLYPAGVDPPDHAAGQAVLRLPAGSSSPTLEVVVEAGGPSVRLALPGDDVTLEISSGSVHIQVGDDLQARLETAGGGRVELAAGQSAVTLKGSGDVTLKAAGKLTIDATEVAVSGTAKVSLKAALLELN
jgi:uncharacterized protein involved in type VI secretion and phage assembly